MNTTSGPAPEFTAQTIFDATRTQVARLVRDPGLSSGGQTSGNGRHILDLFDTVGRLISHQEGLIRKARDEAARQIDNTAKACRAIDEGEVSHRAKYGTLLDDISDHQKAFRSIQARIDSLTEELDTTHKSLESTNADFAAYRISSKSALEDKEAECMRAAKETAAANERATRLAQQLSEMEAASQREKVRESKAIITIANMEGKTRELESQVRRLTGRLQAATDTATETKAELREVERDRNALTLKYIEQMSKLMTEHEAKVEDLHERYEAEAERQSASTQARILALTAEREQLRKKVENLSPPPRVFNRPTARAPRNLAS